MQNQIDDNIIYLDHAATTPLSPAARTAMIDSYDAMYGNPSSMHCVGRIAYDALEKSRRQCAGALAVDPKEIIFTGSGTESDNLAILGLARAHRQYGNHIIVSTVEHKAVLTAAKQLEKEGFSVTYLPVNQDGLVSVAELKKALRPETALVSVMYANNEIGTIQPIHKVVAICREYQPDSQYPLVHTDACQAVGQLPIAPRELGVDAMTINSSKIYGPKGIGLLYLRHGTDIEPLIVGGDQERGLRAGTESIALTAGFAAALSESVTETDAHTRSMCELQNYFVEELRLAIPDICFNGHPTKRLPNNVHVTIPDIEGESLVLMLSEYGICAATGSACSSLDLEPSYVLVAIGQDEEVIHGSLRFTFGRNTTKDDLRYTARTLGEITKRLRTITACTTTAYQNLKSIV